MAVFDFSFWQWLVLFQQELLLFAGIFFLIGAIDDIALDFVWLWLRLTGRGKTPRLNRTELQQDKLHKPLAVFIPAWDEASVIGTTIGHLLKVWPQADMRLYVGVCRNDPATIEAVMQAASGDRRIRLVIHDRDGPTTKADCLNRLYQAMTHDEQRSGNPYAAVVFQDAEDFVDPAALGLLDRAIAQGADFTQLPVEPLAQPKSRWVGSHYCEEFVEAHAKAMVVRGALNVGLPGAGVGSAISRKALHDLCRERADELPFAADSLTEDYELGLAVHQIGGESRFVRARGDDGRLIATRAYFPSRLDLAVRQKSRWVLGIALQGWDKTGWSRGLAETWMRIRDRRGPLTAIVLVVGYTLLFLTLASWAAQSLGHGEPMVLSPFVRFLLYANLVGFGWRAVFRFVFTARHYGFIEGLMAVLRIPLTNVIAIMAGRRALFAYARTLLGKSGAWDKTDHHAIPVRAAALPAVAE